MPSRRPDWTEARSSFPVLGHQTRGGWCRSLLGDPQGSSAALTPFVLFLSTIQRIEISQSLFIDGGVESPPSESQSGKLS